MGTSGEFGWCDFHSNPLHVGLTSLIVARGCSSRLMLHAWFRHHPWKSQKCKAAGSSEYTTAC